jgi:hypothetical protein
MYKTYFLEFALQYLYSKCTVNARLPKTLHNVIITWHVKRAQIIFKKHNMSLETNQHLFQIL